MSNRKPSEDQTRRRVIACATALFVALSLTKTAHADRVVPPSVPANLQVPTGSKAFLEGHAAGTQNYICLPSGSGVAWAFFGPQATLFTHNGQQVITHFLSPNPFQGGTPRATWQHSSDTSTVWAQAIASSSDSGFVAPGAIPWLLLQVVGTQYEPTGSRKLAKTAYIQRVNTSGGVAPQTGCAVATDIGKSALVHYETDYIFYE